MANINAARIVLADRKRGNLLSYQGYLFARNRTRTDKIYWRCVDKSCAVFMHTPVFVAIPGAAINVTKEPSGHCHPPSDVSIQRREMIHEMLNIVHADPCAPIRSAYDQVTAGRSAAHRPFADEAVPTFSSLETILRRRRSEAFPPTPASIDDVIIQGEWAVTWLDVQHLSLLDNQWGIAVFMTDRYARFLGECDTIFVDGTFRTAPRPYHQLLTIHGLYRGTVIPLCFALLSGKTIGHYRQVLAHVAAQVNLKCHRPWNPVNAISDFEVALVAALQTELPQTRVRGCYFHFAQSLWRKVTELGLVTHYRDNSSGGRRLRKIVQKTMAIGFLPSLIISRAFQVSCV